MSRIGTLPARRRAVLGRWRSSVRTARRSAALTTLRRSHRPRAAGAVATRRPPPGRWASAALGQWSCRDSGRFTGLPATDYRGSVSGNTHGREGQSTVCRVARHLRPGQRRGHRRRRAATRGGGPGRRDRL